ncbi:SHOCT domain-containing protein [Arthrobacter sp. NPDC058192]|uniref:SHOCT domain-containing protein n=1 Tax=Arthrobacter sp. NPDC058192 TaxID=3346372 RepID=UPI0036E24241
MLGEPEGHPHAPVDYIRQAAAVSPSDEIAKAKALLDAGTISPAEFEHIKGKVVV